MNKLLLGLLYYTVGQIIIWYQTNGQFLWKWFDKHPVLIAIIFSFPISYSFILGTKYVVEYFSGELWPGRLIGFGVGAVAFGILTYYHMGESITAKTAVSLILAITLVLVQIFWK